MTVVILSAFVPTRIAQQLFRPTIVDSDEEEALGEEDISVIRHKRVSVSGWNTTERDIDRSVAAVTACATREPP